MERPPPTRNRFTLQTLLLLQSFFSVDAFTHEGWRIAMNIGREPETTGMPKEWASSGCRLPVVVKCDFQPGGEGRQKNTVALLDDKVRFTGPDGEVVKPVEPGEWSLSNEREISFTVSFPEELVRRDVTLEGTLRLEGLMYSETDLKRMNARFKEARDSTVDAGELFDSIKERQDAPRKWNDDTNQWEKRYEDEGILSTLGKRTNKFFAERKERKVNAERPILKDLALGCGPFPGVEGDVYFKREGQVMLKRGFLRECRIGTWCAEPINDKPLSYY